MPSYYPLAQEVRAGITDLTHHGYVCVVDERSKVLYHAGDEDAVVFYRSTAKPIQALPVIMRALHTRYGLSEEETVIFSASHAGQSFHVSAMERIMEKAGLTEDMLLMKPTVPLHARSNEERIRLRLPERKLYHNCSGKHLSLLLLQRDLGGKCEDYWKFDSAATLEVERMISIISETKHIKKGVDGCGVPVFAVGMKHIAAAYKNLACIDTIPDERIQVACRAYLPRFNKYPHMIKGTDYLSSVLNEDENLIAKDGVNGVFAIGLRKQRLGVAFKMVDGTEVAWPIVVRRILADLGALSGHIAERLDALFPQVLRNDNDTDVGYREALFSVKN